MPKQLLLIAPFFLFLSALYGQSAMVSDPVFIRTDYGYELIGRLRDRILIFRDRYEDFVVQAFDPQLKLSWVKELDDLDHRGTRILGVVPGRNDFSVVYQTRRRGNTVLRVHKYDPGANLIDSMEVKNYGERIFNTPKLEIVRSEDRNCVVVYNVAERDRIEATCIYLDKMIAPWDYVAFIEDHSDIFESREPQVTLSNSGTFFWITERNNRKAKLQKHELEIIRFDGSGVNVNTTPLGNYLTVDLKFAFDHQNQQLAGAGLWTDKTRDRSSGVFYVRMKPGVDSALALRYEAFDEKFLSVLRQKEGADGIKGIADANLQEILLRQDGGIVLVAERYREVQRGASAGRGFFRDGMRMIIDYYYDDMFVLAIQPNGQIQWKSALHKKQYSQDDDGTFSSYFLMRTPEKMRLFFNDEIKYENTCSEYVLSAAGEFDRNSLLNTLNQSLRLRFRDAMQLNANECLIPSEYRGRLKLVLLRF